MLGHEGSGQSSGPWSGTTPSKSNSAVQEEACKRTPRQMLRASDGKTPGRRMKVKAPAAHREDCKDTALGAGP